MSEGSSQGRSQLSWERAIPRLDRAWGSLGHAGLPQGLLGRRLQEAVTNVSWNSLELTHSQPPFGWASASHQLGGGWPQVAPSLRSVKAPLFLGPQALSAGCLVPFPAGGRVRRTRPPASHIPPRGGSRLGSLGAEPSLALRAGGGKVATPSRPAPVPGGARWKGRWALDSGCGGLVGVQGPGPLGPGCWGPSGRRGAEQANGGAEWEPPFRLLQAGQC